MLTSVLISTAVIAACLLYSLVRLSRFDGRLQGRVVSRGTDDCHVQVPGACLHILGVSSPVGALVAIDGTPAMQSRDASYREPAMEWVFRPRRLRRVWPSFGLRWLAALAALFVLGGWAGIMAFASPSARGFAAARAAARDGFHCGPACEQDTWRRCDRFVRLADDCWRCVSPCDWVKWKGGTTTAAGREYQAGLEACGTR